MKAQDSAPHFAIYYLTGIALLGLAFAALAVFHVVWSSPSDSDWVYFLVVVLLGALIPIPLPHSKSERPWLHLTLNDVFIFASLLLFSPAVAVVLAALDGLLSGLVVHSLKGWRRAVFTSAVASIAVVCAGSAFYALQPTGPPLRVDSVSGVSIVVDLLFCAFLLFTIRTGLVAVSIMLTSEVTFPAWGHNVAIAGLPTVLGALTAAGIVLSFGRTDVYLFVVALPTVVLAYLVYKLTRHRNQVLRERADHASGLYHSTVSALAMAIDAKDQASYGHVYRVQALAEKLAEYWGGLDDNQLEALKAAAVLHDIGKLAVPEYILNKPAPLTEAEMLKMKSHPVLGAAILQGVPYNYPVVPFVRHHHEKWNGTGYPDGLSGDQIPVGARILAIADSYDALTSDRPYRAALGRDLAIDYMKAERGKSYDPQIVDLLVAHLEEVEEAMREADVHVPLAVVRQLQREFEDKGRVQPHRTVFGDIASTYREMQRVYELSEILGKSLSVAEILEIVDQKVEQLVPTEARAIFLIAPDGARLLCEKASGMHADKISQVAMKVGEGVTGWVTLHAQVLLNTVPGPDFADSSGELAVFRSCLSVPIAFEDRVLGAITCYSSQVGTFDQEDIRLLETAAHYAAIAINNAIMLEETQEDAYTDLITGLPNLRYFKQFAEQELKRAARIDYPVTLLMMDLERFKEVNDRFGHKIGDLMLAGVAAVLRNQMRKSDTCVRYAGDEFVAILPGTSRDQARQTIERIQGAVDSFRMPVRENQFAHVGISIGAASFPEDSHELEQLLSIADTAMYANKAARSQRTQKGEILPFERP